MNTRPPFANYPRLQKGELVLRELTNADLDAVTNISYYDGVKAQNEAQAKQMLLKIREDYDAGNSIHWGIARHDDNQVLGTCGYYRGFEDNTGELGCILHSDHYNKGYMGKALLAAIDFGLDVLKLERIIAVTSVENNAALRLLKRLRFEEKESQEEGLVLFEHKPV